MTTVSATGPCQFFADVVGHRQSRTGGIAMEMKDLGDNVFFGG